METKSHPGRLCRAPEVLILGIAELLCTGSSLLCLQQCSQWRVLGTGECHLWQDEEGRGKTASGISVVLQRGKPCIWQCFEAPGERHCASLASAFPSPVHSSTDEDVAKQRHRFKAR